MQVHLQSNENKISDNLDGNWRDVDDSFTEFVQLDKKVKVGKLLKNFAMQVHKDQGTETSCKSLFTSLKEIKNQIGTEEMLTVLPMTTKLLESSNPLDQKMKDKILHEILLFAKLMALKTVNRSAKCSLTLAISQMRKLAKFIKEVRRDALDSKKDRETLDDVKPLLNKAEKNCDEATKLMEKYDSPSTSERDKKDLLEKIKQQRDLILRAYETILEKIGK